MGSVNEGWEPNPGIQLRPKAFQEVLMRGLPIV